VLFRSQDFNSRVGYELRPGESYLYVSLNGEFENFVLHNQRGLHDIEHDIAKPEDVFRVLVLADSYGHAREVPPEDNFARLLEEWLNSTAPLDLTVEVINAGHFGLGTTQEYLYYTTEGHRYDPDLVLLAFYVGNDVLDNHAPLVRAWNDINTVDFPTFAPDGELRQPGMAWGRRILSWLRHNSFVAHTLAGGTEEVERVEVGDPGAVTERALHVPMGVYLPPDETWTDAWTVTGYALAELKAAVEADGARLAVFVIPDRRQVYDEDWNATLDRLPDLDPATLDRDRPAQAILALLAEHDIAALSLLDLFRATGQRLYFKIDGHFNPAGHALTAEEVSGWLIDHGLVPREQHPAAARR
jgi:lysophospholipase L1-like esterase